MTETTGAPDFATSAPLPAIPGLRFRHFGGRADYAGMNDAANDARLHDGDSFITELEGFASFYDHLVNCDRDRDVLIVEVDGSIAGYGRASWRLTEEGARAHELICFLRAAWRRRGIGRAMLAALETRAREAASELGPIDEAFFEASGQVADGGVPALLESAGYTAVRYGFQMVRPTLDDAPDAPMPDGLEIREVREEDLRKIWDAADEAFRDGWGYRAPTEEDYQVFLADPLSQDRSLWRVAWDGDEVAGQVRGFINEDANRAFGRKWGWVENISVRRPWRRRGLARALMNETFKALRERGMTEGTLGVDALNPTGALRIYESIGFRPVSESRVYRKPFPARAR